MALRANPLASNGSDFLVSAGNPDGGYMGPVARVGTDGVWLCIVTDDYAGVVLNIEALPALQEALAKIAAGEKPGPSTID